MTDFDFLTNLTNVSPLVGLERKLKAGETVHIWELSHYLDQCPDDHIPPRVRSYLRGLIEGTIPRPKGRVPMPESLEHRRKLLITGHYDRYLAWLEGRKKRQGNLDAWKPLADSHDAPNTPASLAAILTSKKIAAIGYSTVSLRRVQNIASSH